MEMAGGSTNNLCLFHDPATATLKLECNTSPTMTVISTPNGPTNCIYDVTCVGARIKGVRAEGGQRAEGRPSATVVVARARLRSHPQPTTCPPTKPFPRTASQLRCTRCMHSAGGGAVHRGPADRRAAGLWPRLCLVRRPRGRQGFHQAKGCAAARQPRASTRAFASAALPKIRDPNTSTPPRPPGSRPFRGCGRWHLLLGLLLQREGRQHRLKPWAALVGRTATRWAPLRARSAIWRISRLLCDDFIFMLTTICRWCSASDGGRC